MNIKIESITFSVLPQLMPNTTMWELQCFEYVFSVKQRQQQQQTLEMDEGVVS